MHRLAAIPVLCTGFIRSGSTWSFNVCRHLAEWHARQRAERAASAYLQEAALEEWVAQGLDRLAGPTVIKAHEVGPRAIAALRVGAARAVCTIRDPRDCVASDVTFNQGWLDQSLRRVNTNLSYLPFYKTSRHTLFVRYEEMVANPLRQVTRIAAHMGVDADPLELRRIDAMTSMANAKATAAGLRHRRSEEVLWCDGRRVDPTTQLHENHVRQGRVGGWRDELTAAEQEQLTETFYPWLVELGYEPARNGPSTYA